MGRDRAAGQMAALKKVHWCKVIFFMGTNRSCESNGERRID
jgi:hypothetical protein